MTFKTWNADGTAASYHRTAVLNAAAEKSGRAGYEAAKLIVDDAERVSGVIANMALEAS